MPNAQDNFCIVLVTAPDEAVAQKLARTVLEQKLAACVNVIPGMISFFWWQNKIDEQAEVLLVIKTMQAKVSALMAAVKQAHPYEVPEIISLPIVEGSEDYLRWVRDSVA
jgi:periplasmic divalent cation tolerance protein